MRFNNFGSVYIVVFCLFAYANGTKINVYTVATDDSDGLQRLLRSGRLFGFNIKVLGLGSEWRGGDVARGTGGAQKVNILAEELKTLCSRSTQTEKLKELFMFVDAYDVVIAASPKDILESFERLKAKVVISAEIYLWPDRTLARQYPPVSQNEYPFLCSGGFVGYVEQICEMILPRTPLADDDDDQLFYTKIFLDPELRERLSIKLDTKAEIFQNLHGALDHVTTKFAGKTVYAFNKRTLSLPKVLHGNGPIKVALNRITDYIPNAWSTTDGCLFCMEDRISLENKKAEEMPIVVVAVFIERPSPFLPQMLQNIWKLDYPKSRIGLFIHNEVPYHQGNVTDFLLSIKVEDCIEFTLIGPEMKKSEGEARNLAIDACERIKCDYIFMVDSLAQITLPDTLRLLIEQNRSTIAPLLKRHYDSKWSNFWGQVSSDGFYVRSDDYLDILKGEKRGIWNVPYISNAYLIQADRLKKFRNIWLANDPEMAFCAFNREKGMFMYVSNTLDFGHLIDPDNYNTSRLHPELWEISTNRYDWEQLYIDPARRSVFGDHEKNEVCRDVYAFPLVTPLFCDHLIDVMENYGEWSPGRNNDRRLKSGYENVPTVDIHMNQIGYQEQWVTLIKTYISPLAQHVYTGYQPKSVANMNFVVRYQPGEQGSLQPHFDSSTYSANIALRQIGVDFEGGGTRFVRSNCSVLNQKEGWALIHPGRLTHWHEGLEVTKGIRYIAVSFIDP